MKPTSAPRARSASATASAGITWPPVPPAAITTLTGRGDGEPAGLSLGSASDVDKESRAGEEDDQAAAAEGHERQRHAGDGQHADHSADVDGRLHDHERREA